MLSCVEKFYKKLLIQNVDNIQKFVILAKFVQFFNFWKLITFDRNLIF